ncbi:MAG: APC family permease [Pseudolysinimonas sp.]
MARSGASEHDGAIGFFGAVSIGVGGMVGGGIFAVLGLAISLGQGGTFVAFLIAGLVALVTAYSYARLSVAFPSQGGTVEFLNQAFGSGRFSGSLNVLLWLSYVITTALYAFAFGSYGSTFLSVAAREVGSHILITGVIVGVAVLNVFSARLIAAAEDYIVGAKVLILCAFVVAALLDADFSAIKPGEWASSLSLVSGGMLIFVAYEGFELIANSAGDVRSPRKTIPRALYASVIFTIVLYTLVAVVTVGLLSLSKIAGSSDFVLAEAARVVWGGVGFKLIAVAALLSTASAINATLYGTSRLTVVIAVDGELPSELERTIGGRPLLGLLITAVTSLLIANLIPLSAISSLASAGFLIIFACTNAANVRMADRTNSRRWLSRIGVVVCAGALVALVVHISSTSPADLILLAGLLGLTIAGAVTYQKRVAIMQRRAASSRPG